MTTATYCDWQQIADKPGHFRCPECKRLYGGPKGQRRAKFLCERLAMRVCVLPSEEHEKSKPRQLPPNIAALAQSKKREKRGPCQHLGKPTGATQECDTCRGKAKIKLFACAVHGVCSIGKALPGIATCASCHDYSPSKRDEDADSGVAG